MEIFITALAQQSLKRIYQYFSLKASVKVARRIKDDIIVNIERLTEHPFIGQLEPTLQHIEPMLYYLVCGNFKIIYCVHDEVIYIMDIFDTRRNPTEMLV